MLVHNMQAGDHTEVFDAYDAALAASAAQVQEAQAAAAALAAQLADCELQLQQQSRPEAVAGARPGSPAPSADAAAVAAAVEAHAARTGRSSNTSSSSCPALGPLAALRQHQKNLEKQLAKQHAELTKQQRENLRLMRLKRQFETAGQRLKDAAAAQAAAESAAQQAGLKAKAEAGKAERLQQQVGYCADAGKSCVVACCAFTQPFLKDVLMFVVLLEPGSNFG